MIEMLFGRSSRGSGCLGRQRNHRLAVLPQKRDALHKFLGIQLTRRGEEFTRDTLEGNYCIWRKCPVDDILRLRGLNPTRQACGNGCRLLCLQRSEIGIERIQVVLFHMTTDRHQRPGLVERISGGFVPRQMLHSVFLVIWYYATDTTLRIANVARITWYQMDMGMENSLTRNGTYVDPKVESIGSV